MTTDNIQNITSLFFGSTLIIHSFIMYYALDDTSENLYKFRENHSKNAWK